MSQHDFVIANAGGAPVRADINDAIQALASLSLGATAPATTYAGMYWLDTTLHVLKQRNEANSAWRIVNRADAEGVLAKTANYTVQVRDFGKLIDATSGTWTLTLPPAATVTDGFFFDLRNSGAGIITVDPDSSETIDGVATLAVPPNESFRVMSNGTLWRTIGRSAVASSNAVPALSPDGIVKYVTAATVDIDADYCVVADSLGNTVRLPAINLTANVGSAGANGLDTGAEGSSRFYFIYVIYNGTTVAALLSESASAPTLPSGYTYKALVGFIRNDGSSNFVRTWINARKVTFADTNVLNAVAVAVAGTYQSLDISAVVPAIARTVGGIFGASASPSLTQAYAIAGSPNGEGKVLANPHSFSGAPFESFEKGTSFDGVPLITPQTIYWTSNLTTASSRINISKCTF